MNREQWLERRKEGIGASEVGAILGLSDYETPMSLWAQKLGKTPPKEETLAMWLGHEMEPIIAKRYEMETGRKLVDPGDYAILQSPDVPFLFSTLDRKAHFDGYGWGPVEMKAPGERTKDDWADGGSPLIYQAQLQVQMFCMGAQVGEIAAIIGNSEFLIRRYEYNSRFMDAIIPVLSEFWFNVKHEIPPTIDGGMATSNAIRKLHPEDNGETIELPDELIGDAILLDSIQEAIATAEAERDAIKNNIMYAMGPNTYATINGKRWFSYKTNKGGKRTLRRIAK